ncbi:MAG: hypothetical protein ACK476_17435, partial [Fluviicola sp.]
SNSESNLTTSSNFVDNIYMDKGKKLISEKKCISKIELNINDFSINMKTQNFLVTQNDLIIPSNCYYDAFSKSVFFHILSKNKDKFGFLNL